MGRYTRGTRHHSREELVEFVLDGEHLRIVRVQFGVVKGKEGGAYAIEKTPAHGLMYYRGTEEECENELLHVLVEANKQTITKEGEDHEQERHTT